MVRLSSGSFQSPEVKHGSPPSATWVVCGSLSSGSFQSPEVKHNLPPSATVVIRFIDNKFTYLNIKQ